MSIPKLLVLLSIALTSLVSAAHATANGSSYDAITWTTHASTSSSCAWEDEFEMESAESSRRMLAGSQYISYGALNRNKVPCNQRGASYYNCQQGAQANPYSRGCSTISRCRS
uniref:Uncharacterized protein n=1 Tax=Kalanchoe fedtschenkoi TaxID=63787 RepID=A0A7N0R7U2_KALFE